MPAHLTRSTAVRIVALGSITAVALTACSSSSSGRSTTDTAGASGSASTAAKATDPHTANITITSAKCVADRSSYDAGALTFKISNTDATGITEVELLQGERILGEKENIPPGFSGTFSLQIPAGTYQLYCPGATTERVPLTVTGTGGQSSSPANSTQQLLADGIKTYASYVDTQIQLLVDSVAALDSALKGTDLAAAQAAYDKARPYYERIEPVAESFADLDPAIDNRADDTAPTKITGFHRIEYGLFAQKKLTGLSSVGDQLVANVGKLQTLAKTLKYQPADLANGATGLLEEVATSKITGEEERYSHIDLLDFQANVEGSQQAFANLQPGLEKIDPTLSKTIASAFQTMDNDLDQYRDTSQPSGFKLYTSLTKDQIKKLSNELQSVKEPLSQVASKVVNA